MQARRIVALVGRPNVGKSSLYNRLTGGEAHVGNYPGVTVDILDAEAALPGGELVTLTDLPGVYSVSVVEGEERDSDEGIARGFLDEADPQRLLILQVLDATQLGDSLRLTRELLWRPARLLLVVTQHDRLHAQGRELDHEGLQRALGVSVLVVSARDKELRAEVLAQVERLFAAPLAPHQQASLDYDADALAARVLRELPRVDAQQRRRREQTARLDGVLLHPLLGPVLFLLLMAVLFAGVYQVAEPFKDAMALVQRACARWLSRRIGEGLLGSFLVDGVLGGAGTVLTFLPQIVLLTLVMDLLEASGYLARGAFLVDRLLRAVGLGGRAFVPLLTGHACAVPAIAATRVIRDPRQRLLTVLVLPLMTCSARLPTYGLLIAAFFAHRGAWFKSLIQVGLYAAGLCAGMLAAVTLSRVLPRRRGLPLVLELPAYRAPEPRVLWRSAARTSKRFVRDVGTVILLVSLVLWALLQIPISGKVSGGPSARAPHSVAASVGRTLEPVTRPLGFDWRINVGLIASFGARELMVSTMAVISGMEEADENDAGLQQQLARRYSTATAAALLAFFVLACQCMSTVAAIRRETRSWRWPLLVLLYTYAAAYGAALLTYQIVRALS